VTWHRIQNRNSGKLLAVSGMSLADSAEVTQYARQRHRRPRVEADPAGPPARVSRACPPTSPLRRAAVGGAGASHRVLRVPGGRPWSDARILG
jgi:hypothetical protein